LILEYADYNGLIFLDTGSVFRGLFENTAYYYSYPYFNDRFIFIGLTRLMLPSLVFKLASNL